MPLNSKAELKKKSLVDYIDNHTSYRLNHSGKNYSCPCPFHNENESSFYINPEKNRWTCYGKCDANGDLIDFVCRDKNINFSEALEHLCRIYNLPFQKRNKNSQADSIKEICNFTAQFYTTFVNSNFTALEYLTKKRRQAIQVLKKFDVGYAPTATENGWQTLASELYKQKFNLSLCEKIGLIKKGTRGNYIDSFRGRVVFPVYNVMGDCIGFNTRLIEKGVNAPRYLLSNETEIFSRNKIYYGLNHTRKIISEKKALVLVEGIFDFYRLYGYGIHNAMPLLGGHFNMLDNVETYYLMMDPDKAGEKYNTNIGKILIKDRSVFVCDLKRDPDENTKKEIVESIRNKKNFVDWYVGRLYKHDTVEHKVSILKKFGKMLNGVNEINMCLYTKVLSDRLQLPSGVVVSVLTKNKPKYKDIYEEFENIV